MSALPEQQAPPPAGAAAPWRSPGCPRSLRASRRRSPWGSAGGDASTILEVMGAAGLGSEGVARPRRSPLGLGSRFRVLGFFIFFWFLIFFFFFFGIRSKVGSVGDWLETKLGCCSAQEAT